MKFTIAIALMGLFALSSALSVSNEFASGTSASLKEPLNQVIQEINEEKKEDQRVVDRAKQEQKMAEDEAATAKATYEESKKKAEAEHAAWKKTEADLLLRETEYASNDETRTKEEGHIASIRKAITQLVTTGPAGGKIGTMPTTAVATAKAAVTEYIQMAANPEKAQAVLNLLERGHSKVEDIKSNFNSLEGSITTERSDDVKSVDRQKAVVKAANTKYEEAETERVSKLDDLDEANHKVTSAKELVATEQKNFDAAQKIRDEDLQTIQEAMKLIDELIATETTHKAGLSGQELLQVDRSSAALTKLRTKIADMIKDVDEEERVQKLVLNTRYQQAVAAHRAYLAAHAAYLRQVIVHNETEHKWKDWYSKYHGAEMALAQEIAIAEQERSSINSVRELLKKLQSAEANVLGACPKDSDGAVCGGFGACKTNTTDPMKHKYCQCNAGSGRTGRTCGMCKFGWKMATGQGGLKGFCQQVYIPTVTFIQTDTKKVSMEELNNAVEAMVQTGRHEQHSAGIESVLAAIEKTLDDQEKMMRKERDDTKLKSDEYETKTQAEKTKMLELKAVRVKKGQAYVMARRIFQAIKIQYNFEKPLRDKERDLLNKIDAIVLKLQGNDVATSAPTQPPTKFVGTNTHTPTTTPTVKAAQ